MTPPFSRNRQPRAAALQIFSLIFVVIFLLHLPLLRLPFFWDEAGYYVPAAYDLAHDHVLIPRTTLDTGHPPLPAAYLAAWFALFGWKPGIARIAMLLVAAFALTNVFLLAKHITNTAVAVASTIATGLYPIFFVQSSMVHADLTAAAFTLWGIRLAVTGNGRRSIMHSQIAFCLAVLCKETAVITPLALGLWELFDSSRGPIEGRIRKAAIWFTPLLPLLAWLGYHYYVTGRFFGNREFFQYNVAQTLNPLRFVLAVGLRLWGLFGIMNMLALTAATLVAMFFPPVVDQSGKATGRNKDGVERKRIAIPVQLQFASIMLAHVVVFSLLGGALLTRYLLPAYPLVIMIGMSTLYRRIPRWEWAAAGIIGLFVMALFVDPPYRFAPEDNLRYRDYVELHVLGARFLEQHERDATVLTAWPAQDELTKPYLGYVSRPFQTVPVRDFTVEEIMRARQMPGQYQVAYLFSTKYEAGTWFRPEFWQKLNRRFFDYHQDVSPLTAAEMLGGRVVFLARRKAEWAAIMEIEAPSRLARGPH